MGSSPFSRTLVCLLLLFAAAFPATAQRSQGPAFRELRQRIEAEQDKPASQRIQTLNLLARHRTPQARRLLLDLWKREKHATVRNSVLRLLGMHENARVARILAGELFEGKSAALKRTAASGLLNQEKVGLRALEQALGSRNVATRSAALQAMSSAAPRRDDVAGALMKALPGLPAKEQVRALASLRGRPKSAAFRKTLVPLLDSKDASTAGEALRQLALAEHKGIKERILQRLGDSSLMKNAVWKAALFFALAVIADDETMRPLLEIGMDGGPWVKNELLAISRLPKVRDRFVKGLARVAGASEDAVQRLVAVELLTRFETKAAVRALVDALADRSTAVVLAAMAPLAKRKERTALPQLRKLFAGNHPELRLEAMLAIHEVMKSDPSWPKQLIAQLDAPKIGLRCAAIDLLAKMRHRGALPRVQALIAAPEWQVRSAAYGYLKVMRDKSSIGLLIAAMEKEGGGRLEHECLSALIAITHRNYHKLDYWKKWWASSAETFELPADEGAAKAEGKAAPARPAAVTYYDIPVVSKRTAFLVDTSGSMSRPAGTARDPKIESAKQALIQVLKACDSDLQFNLIPFSGDVRSWVKTLQPMSEPNRLEAIAYTKRLRARGATNIHDALEQAFGDMNVDTIYLLSDGAPSAGKIVDVDELADAVRRWNRDRRIIIHTISFGQDSRLLKRLAEESGGTYVRFI